MDLRTLLVFFEQDKYDGHLWFSSTQKLPEAPTVQRGALNRPDINALESSLRLGESTRADVLAALGEPIGRGMARLPVDPRPNAGAMWSYYYAEVGVSGRMFLFVFFDEDRYEGYMWFSSLPK